MKFLQYITLFILSCSSVFAATGDVEESLVQNIDSDINYVYYYGQGCAYCAKVDTYLTAVDAIHKIDIEKREVYFNDENRGLMAADAEKLGLDITSVGVPFLVIQEAETMSHLIGDTPIIEHFTPVLGEAPESNKQTIVLIVLGLIVFGVIGGLIFWNKK